MRKNWQLPASRSPIFSGLFRGYQIYHDLQGNSQGYNQQSHASIIEKSFHVIFLDSYGLFGILNRLVY